ncbi:hypothetical protein FB451DRAFT_1247281 [Mycena latifolia]|nr:hypothetical protein FB451DRAFT_1247281 [Mycena latifolia]
MASQAPVKFESQQALFSSLRETFRMKKDVEFNGTYQVQHDPLVSDKERVQMVVYEVWKVSGYRFKCIP